MDLVTGAARIGVSIGHAGEIGRKFGADAAPEHREHNIALGGLRDLRLKRLMRPVEFGLPADRLQPCHAGKLAVQSLDDALDAPALVIRHRPAKRQRS